MNTGHNLHQYLYRGTPRHLPEAMRHKLAELLNVKEESLREEEVPPRPASFFISIPFLTTPADTGDGSVEKNRIKISSRAGYFTEQC
ncbi:MAG: hypothetical protein ACPG4I_05635 [Candidatus Puniceispirillaceae bacterium]